MQYLEDGHLELYDLAGDLGEKTNLAATNPAKAKELLARLEAWRLETRAALPTPNKGGAGKDAAAAPAAKKAGKGKANAGGK
jgi:hypothetical protein